MQTQIRRYNIVVKGRVQDIGFRDYVIALANMVKIRGYIFNDIDGSVRMVLEGVKEIVNNFLSEIKSSKDIAGVEIESLQQREIAGDFDLPVRFVKLSTDEMYDIDRKLGIGNDYLKEIKHDTSTLHDIKHDTSMLPDVKRDTSVLPDVKQGIDTLNANFDLYITEQKEHNKRMDEHNQRMDEHNQRLEKILEKVAER
ncbi:MAG: acylphosphatase [Euryarchaeota archaeon]|nr:acylphosphatase [Euryarchaeota archaeon]